MACFLVSAAEAVVVTAAAQIMKNNEMKADSQKLAKKAAVETKQEKHLPWSKKLMILAQLLWGGAFLLCFEHIWHGEVVPWFPFLTAMNDPGDTAEMLHEMSTIGDHGTSGNETAEGRRVRRKRHDTSYLCICGDYRHGQVVSAQG